MTADTTTLALETLTSPLETLTGAWGSVEAAPARSATPSIFAFEDERNATMDAVVAALAAFGATCFTLASALQTASMF